MRAFMGASRIPRTLSGPIVAERHDNDDGEIIYEIWDHGAETYHCLCHVKESLTDNAKAEANFIVLALNNAIGALRAVEMADANEARYDETG